MKKILLILSILLNINITHAQIDGQEVKLFTANVVFGGITTGFGAVINKQKQEKFLPTFIKGFGYGCLGGSLLYTGKKMSNLIYQDKLVAGGWGSKLVHNAGASVMENVSLHRSPFSHYNLYVGFFRLEFDWQKKFTFNPKIMPVTLACAVYSLQAYKNFDWHRSLRSGSIYFNTNRLEQVAGITLRGVITVNEKYKYTTTPAHENVHALQNQEYYILNTYLNKTFERIKVRHAAWNKLSRYFYFDACLLDLTYILARDYAVKNLGCYWKNPYEFEAERMAINRHMNLKDYCK